MGSGWFAMRENERLGGVVFVGGAKKKKKGSEKKKKKRPCRLFFPGFFRVGGVQNRLSDPSLALWDCSRRRDRERSRREDVDSARSTTTGSIDGRKRSGEEMRPTGGGNDRRLATIPRGVKERAGN